MQQGRVDGNNNDNDDNVRGTVLYVLRPQTRSDRLGALDPKWAAAVLENSSDPRQGLVRM